MAERFTLTPRQAVVLRSLGERIVEASATEVAVSTLLSLTEVRNALGELERLGLLNSWVPITGTAAPEQVFVLNDEGRAVVRALDPVKGTPVVGSVARLPHGNLLGWLTGQRPKFVEIVSDGNG